MNHQSQNSTGLLYERFRMALARSQPLHHARARGFIFAMLPGSFSLRFAYGFASLASPACRAHEAPLLGVRRFDLGNQRLGGLGHNIFSSKQGEGPAPHSISSSARSSSDLGIANPSTRAVFRFSSSSYWFVSGHQGASSRAPFMSLAG